MMPTNDEERDMRREYHGRLLMWLYATKLGRRVLI